MPETFRSMINENFAGLFLQKYFIEISGLKGVRLMNCTKERRGRVERHERFIAMKVEFLIKR